MVLDPLSAIGLAGNIVQFIDFSCNILSESRKTYRSATGTSTENVELENVAESLRQFTAQLQTSANGQTPHPGANQAFEKVLESCRGVADELLHAIERLKVQDGPHRRWRSFRQALITLWRKEELSGMEKRLSFLREQVTLHLVSSVSDGQNMMIKKLRGLEEETQSIKVDCGEEINEICNTLQSIQIASSSMPTKDDLDRLHHIIQDSASATEDISKEVTILKSLRHKSMEVRHSRIVAAHKDTFNWIFDAEKLPPTDPRSRIGFSKWLRSKHGIFWVSGKAGSGKSTLMKYICDDRRTMESLLKWAGTASLVTASFYFWSAGSDMQKSQQGLLQSLLYEILSKRPDLIPTVCSGRWQEIGSLSRFQRSAPWGPAELIRAFEDLQGWASPKTKFCFFIDGLDEYEGDHFELLDVMESIVRSPHIKLCLSSRPWNCFEDVLGNDVDRKLYLQDLTRHDIEIYAKTKLKRPANWASTDEDQRRQDLLSMEIVDRAQGVFLWVFLVVRSLQEGLANGDSTSMLQSRLRALPTDLEPYFEHILKSIDRVYQEKSSGMFQVAIEADEPLSLLTYSFLDEEDPNFAIKLSLGPLDSIEIQSRLDDTRRRINGRSKGLLEVSTMDLKNATESSTVEFLHRTVRDFLNTERLRLVLVSMTPSNYNACFALGRALLAIYKTAKHKWTFTGINDSMIAALEVACRAEEQRGTTDILMLDELERTGKARFRSFLESRNAFLVYTIRYGLVLYTSDRLNKQAQLLPTERAGLLMRAVIKSSNLSKWERKHIRMFEMLLRQGFTPNDPVRYMSTVWREFLETYPEAFVNAEDHDEHWHSIARLLILHGANVHDAYQLFDLMMSKARNHATTSDQYVAIVRTIELLLSRGWDPNQSLIGGGTIWTSTLAKICAPGSLWGTYILYGVTTAFLRYGADPLTTYYDHSEGVNSYRPVCEGLQYIVSCVKDHEDCQALELLIARETAYFKSRENCPRKPYLQPKAPLKKNRSPASRIYARRI